MDANDADAGAVADTSADASAAAAAAVGTAVRLRGMAAEDQQAAAQIAAAAGLPTQRLELRARAPDEALMLALRAALSDDGGWQLAAIQEAISRCVSKCLSK